jgi:capsular polysaccharide biosynthesis protein
MVSEAPFPTTRTGTFPDVNRQYSWQSSQFVLDDLPAVLQSRTFAEDVSERLNAQGIPIGTGTVQSSLSAETFYRAVTISSVASRPDIAEAILISAVETLQTRGLKYWDRVPDEGGGLSIMVLNPPGQAAPLQSTTGQLVAVALRTALALAAAIGVAFLLHYLDDRLRDPQQVEAATGMEVVGVIPAESGGSSASTMQQMKTWLNK